MLSKETPVFDIVVIGSGISGLSHILYLEQFFSATKIKPNIALISKGNLNETNTSWAQGGIAAVTLASDNFDIHINDTLVAGNFLNKRSIVEKVIRIAPELIKDLVKWGVDFDLNKEGKLETTREGGHSHHRILHYKDATGKSIQHSLINSIPNMVSIFEHHLVYNIRKDDEGAFHLNIINSKQEIQKIVSSHVVLATGGIGMLFENTTNTEIATGDGISLAHSLGASMSQLSFIQFHPTGLFNPGRKSHLITEALRGEGAILRNLDGEAFMDKYDTRKELAPRDIVSRSILKEMTLCGHDHVLLDCTMIVPKKWKQHFPYIYSMCRSAGIDPISQPIPVIPVQHYICGGVETNEHGMTSIDKLYAIGEVANTGLHGSNRLASNSLLEGIAFGMFSAKHKNTIKKLDRKQLQKLMSTSIGVTNSQERLLNTKREIENCIQTAAYTEFDWETVENKMMYTVSALIIDDAIHQNENTGVFFKI
jgi:L-aspartate oxidase